ncbi:MAG: hypothetical protein HC799_19930 [Limnothrix sp. RL_2_0]|nr:hypothetical protein [Limnothrix sp. RL_2_0]
MASIKDKLNQLSPDRKRVFNNELTRFFVQSKKYDKLARILNDYDFLCFKIEQKQSTTGLQSISAEYDQFLALQPNLSEESLSALTTIRDALSTTAYLFHQDPFLSLPKQALKPPMNYFGKKESSR